MALEAERQAAIGARIKELREARHLPQPVVAERVGVGLRAYQKWEQGKGVAWENFVKLVEVLDTTESYLLNGPADELPEAESQLDRIEQMLGAIVEHLGISSPVDPGEDVERELSEAARTSAQRSDDSASAGRVRQSAGPAR